MLVFILCEKIVWSIFEEESFKFNFFLQEI